MGHGGEPRPSPAISLTWGHRHWSSARPTWLHLPDRLPERKLQKGKVLEIGRGVPFHLCCIVICHVQADLPRCGQNHWETVSQTIPQTHRGLGESSARSQQEWKAAVTHEASSGILRDHHRNSGAEWSLDWRLSGLDIRSKVQHFQRNTAKLNTQNVKFNTISKKHAKQNDHIRKEAGQLDPHPEGVLMKADPLHHSVCSSPVAFGVQKQGRERSHFLFSQELHRQAAPRKWSHLHGQTLACSDTKLLKNKTNDRDGNTRQECESYCLDKDIR